MKNVIKLLENSHMSGSSESESPLNKYVKSNNSLKRFNKENSDNEIKSELKMRKQRINNQNQNKISTEQPKIEPFTIKFLNKTLKENEEKLYNKELIKSMYKSPENYKLKQTQKLFKIIFQPFSQNDNKNNLKKIFSNSLNQVKILNPLTKKIGDVPDDCSGKNKAELKKHLIFYNRHLNQSSLLFKDQKLFNLKETKEIISNKKETNEEIFPDYLKRNFPIIKNAESYSISDIINSPDTDKLGYSKTATSSFYPNKNDLIEIKKYYTKLKNEKIKVEEDVINKDNYYRRLLVINKKENNSEVLNEKDLIKNYQKLKILVTDKKPLDTYMPPGLVKSPNSGDFYKFNLYDEIKKDENSNNLDNSPDKIHNLKRNENEKHKQLKRLMTPRMLIFKKNDPDVKFKVLSDFIDKIKKIYVILDGAAVLNLSIVPGKFIDIPTVKYMEEIKSKKERIQILYKFIETCRDAFGLNVKIKNIYDHKGKIIYDIGQIPDESNFIYVSTNEIFVGISIINYNEKTDTIIDKKETAHQNRNKINHNLTSNVKISYFEQLRRSNNDKVKLNNLRKNDIKQVKTLNYVVKKEEFFEDGKNFLDKQRNYSFDGGYFISKSYLEDEKLNELENRRKISKLLSEGLSSKNKRIAYILSERYLSDDENNKTEANQFLSKFVNDPFKLWTYFLDYFTSMNKFFTKNKIIQAFKNNKEKQVKKNSFIKRLEEEEQKNKLFSYNLKNDNQLFERINNNKKIEDEIIEVIDNFNKTIEKKLHSLDDYIRKKKIRKAAIRADCPDKRTLKLKKEMVARTKLIMKNFLLGFQLFRYSKESRGDYLLSDKADKKELKYVTANKKKHDNIYFDLDKNVNSNIPTLFSFNIPKILDKYKNFTRPELYDLFVQYKVIMKISLALSKDRSIAKKGIDFMGFYKGVPQISNESTELAQKIFNVINESKTNYLSLHEFLKGMSVIKSEEISDKIDEFFKIIDSDGNGQLSWQEVYEISMISLKRSLVVEEEKSEGLLEELAEYFADLIFKLVDIDKDEEIPLPTIKEKIEQGGEEAKYLEMFCCADNFKK